MRCMEIPWVVFLSPEDEILGGPGVERSPIGVPPDTPTRPPIKIYLNRETKGQVRLGQMITSRGEYPPNEPKSNKKLSGWQFILT